MIKFVTKFCAGCVHEREILWHIEQDGSLETFCPYRGRRHMPCDERQHDPKEEIKRAAASAKEAAEACASARDGLLALAIAFAELREAMERERKQGYLENVRNEIYGGRK